MKFNIKNKIGNFLLDSFLYSFLSTNGNLQRIILKVISKGLICFSFAPRQHLLTLVRVWLYMIVKIRKLFAFFPSALFNWSISSHRQLSLLAYLKTSVTTAMLWLQSASLYHNPQWDPFRTSSHSWVPYHGEWRGASQPLERWPSMQPYL